jgi:hypothetical protein
MVDIPLTPCDCITVDPAAIACVVAVVLLYVHRQLLHLRQHQLLNPRDASIELQQAADAVILCDVMKLCLGLVLAHCFLFVHEAIVSNGGRDETRYFFLVHLARAFVDIALVSFVAHIIWSRMVVPYVNYLIANGHVDDRSSVFCAALRASGRYNATYALNWEHADSMDFRVDADEVASPHLEPSVLHHRAARRIAEETSAINNDDEGDDTSDPTAQLTRNCRGNPYEPLLAWWRHQTVVWCGLIFLVAAFAVGAQLIWRELLGASDPLLYILERFTDAIDGSGDLVCGGERDGSILGGKQDADIIVLSWIALLCFHLIMSLACLAVLHRVQRYKGRTTHPAHVAAAHEES